MNKNDLIAVLANKQGLSKTESRQFVDLFFNSIADALSSGNRVEIRGLCSFKVKEYHSYNGRNPKTGELVTVKPKRLPFFKPGAELRTRVDREKQ